MPVYHSRYTEEMCTSFKKTCKAPVLPLREGSVKGPSGIHRGDEMDIVDEALLYFRANLLFKGFEVKSGSDLVIVYLTAWFADCLRKLEKAKDIGAAKKIAHTEGVSKKFSAPGDKKFPFGGFFDKTKSASEKTLFMDYFQQLRHEAIIRLLAKCYKADGTQDKFWFQFSKRKFMNVYNM